jgi:hypothetical protein
MTQSAEDLLQSARARLARVLGAPLPSPRPGAGAPLTGAEAAYLQEEGESLYWNELEWEHITDEEQLDGGPLAELTFPGFLAYVRGLLLDEVMPDAQAPAEPRPEAVEGLLLFLAGQVLDLQESAGGEGPEAERVEVEIALTRRLLDLVLALLHRIPREALDRSEVDAPGG